MKNKYFAPALLALLLTVGQTTPVALAQENNDALLSAIRQIVANAVTDLKTEIADLKNQLAEQKTVIQSLRRESQETRKIATESGDAGVGQEVSRQIAELKNELKSVLLSDREFRRGDFDPGIERFQQCLVEMGELSRTDFEIGKGNYGPRTSVVILKLQRQYSLPETGVFDKSGRNALFLATQTKGACGIPSGITFEELERGEEKPMPKDVSPDSVPTPTTIPTPTTPKIPTTSQTSLSILSPAQNQTIAPGATIPLKWETKNAPVTSWIKFGLQNAASNDQHDIKIITAGTGVINSALSVPANLTSGQYKLTANLYLGSEYSPQYLTGTGFTVNITAPGATAPTTTVTPTTITTTNTQTNGATNSSAEDETTGKYKESVFVNCMNNQGEAGTAALATIHGWIDSGLLRSQFPWGELQGAEANAVPPCESEADIADYTSYGGGEYYETQYGPCSNLDQNSCGQTNNCYWWGGNDGSTPYCYYSESEQPTYGDCGNNYNQSSCSSQPGCTWYDTFCEGDNYQQGGGGESGSSSSMQNCFYPDASINGQAPGYTVWCEADYYNCRQGDPTGTTVPLDGLSLGAPSFCESGYPSSSNTWESSLANTLSSMQQILSNMSKLFR